MSNNYYFDQKRKYQVQVAHIRFRCIKIEFIQLPWDWEKHQHVNQKLIFFELTMPPNCDDGWKVAKYLVPYNIFSRLIWMTQQFCTLQKKLIFNYCLVTAISVKAIFIVHNYLSTEWSKNFSQIIISGLNCKTTQCWRIFFGNY